MFEKPYGKPGIDYVDWGSEDVKQTHAARKKQRDTQ